MTDTRPSWPAPIEPSDIVPGDIVGTMSGPHMLVNEVREPRHPAISGVIITGHFYVSGEARWSDRESTINTARDPILYRYNDAIEHRIADERFDAPRGVVAFRSDDIITVRQTMQWEGRVGRWPMTWQGMDALARRADPTARLHMDVTREVAYAVHNKWTRRYRTASTRA